MALIECYECGAEISEKAKACIKCGAPVRHAVSQHGKIITTQQTGKKYKGAQLVGAALMCVGVVSCAAKEPLVAAPLSMLGLIVFLGARIGAWWNHG